MHLSEVSLSREERRPGAQPYSSDVRWASVKVTVHPGEDMEKAIELARNALNRAFLNAPLQRNVPLDAPSAQGPQNWQVRVGGVARERQMMAKLGMRWDRDAFVEDFSNEAQARAFAERAELKGRDVKVVPPRTKEAA